MTCIIKLLTLNVDGLHSGIKVNMLERLLCQQEIDIALLQEVTSNNIQRLRGYTTHVDEGTEKRGTAIAVREGLSNTDIKRLPTGRGLAANYDGLWILNFYAPSGTDKKAEREKLFNSGLNYLIPTTQTEMVVAGDFKCIVNATESTGHTNYSRTLQTMIKGLALNDAWDTTRLVKGYTHFTAHSASRLDRIYMTTNAQKRKTGI
jgi:exonuclease III